MNQIHTLTCSAIANTFMLNTPASGCDAIEILNQLQNKGPAHQSESVRRRKQWLLKTHFYHTVTRLIEWTGSHTSAWYTVIIKFWY